MSKEGHPEFEASLGHRARTCLRKGEGVGCGDLTHLHDPSDAVNGVLRAADLKGVAAPVEVHLHGHVLGALGAGQAHALRQGDLHWRGGGRSDLRRAEGAPCCLCVSTRGQTARG